MSKKNRYFGFSLIFTGLLFFCNPYFAAIDILPDCLGCLLICLGLIPLSRISAPMGEARRAFLLLAAADAAKNGLLMAVFGISSPVDRSTMMLTLALAGTVLGLIFVIPAFRALFDGMEYLALAEGCDYLYGRRSVKKRRLHIVARAPFLLVDTCHAEKLSRNERLKRLSIIFLVTREVLCLLPEFAALLNKSYVDSNFTFLYDYIGLMRFFAAVPVVFFGLFWLVSLILYFVGIKKQTDFRRQISERYGAFMATHPGAGVKVRHGVAFLLLTAGAVFTADFYLDFQNVLPDVLAGSLLVLGVLCLQIENKYRILGALAGIAYTAAAHFATGAAYDFVMNYTVGTISRDEGAAHAYFTMWSSAFVEMLVFLFLLLILMLALRRVIYHHAGYRPEYIEESGFESRSILQLREEFDKRLILCYVFGFLSAVMSFLYDYIKEWPKDIKAYRMLEFLWIPDLLLAILFAAYLGYLLSQIHLQIQAKYQYE